MKNLTKKGFTLVELLVVISIIGLLSTIAIVSLGSARAKSRDTKRIADMKQVSTALEQFYSDQGGYPAVTAVLAAWVSPATAPTAPVTTTAGDVVVLGSAVAKVLGSTNATSAAGTAAGTIGTANTGTIYMGNIPAYPTPGQAGKAVDCSAFGAAYCYMSNATWTATTYATDYRMFWQLEAQNPAANLNGTNCTTSNTGVTCV
jgi:prepilin-type N-terminal cleavage/methylation domain-containing protein